jgi:hypothetical protein
MVKYSNKRHILLQKYNNILCKQNKVLFTENIRLFSELLTYQVLLEKFIVWNLRGKFLVLFQQFEN